MIKYESLLDRYNEIKWEMNLGQYYDDKNFDLTGDSEAYYSWIYNNLKHAGKEIFISYGDSINFKKERAKHSVFAYIFGIVCTIDGLFGDINLEKFISIHKKRF